LYNLADQFFKEFIYWISSIDDGNEVQLIDHDKMTKGELSLKIYSLKIQKHFWPMDYA